MANNIYESLEFSRVVRQDICVIGDTDTAHTYWSNPEAEVGGVGCGETRVNITFEMARGPLMALSVPFVFVKLSTQSTVLLYVRCSVLICVTAVVQEVTSLTACVELT